MQLEWRPYRFALQPPMVTACGPWSERCGWLLRLEDPQSSRLSWGEAAPMAHEHALCAASIRALPTELTTGELNDRLVALPGPVAFAIGLALAELEGLLGDGWLPAPASALLLPAGGDAIPALEHNCVSMPMAVGIAPLLDVSPCVWSMKPSCNGWSNH